MSIIEKYNKAFSEGLNIPVEKISETLKYQDIPEWDSVGHMGLVASIEDTFGIEMDTDDIINFSSYEVGINILKKYKVEF